MTVNDLVKRLQEIQEGAPSNGELEVKVYFQNTGSARDFDCVGIYGQPEGLKHVWLSDLGNDD